MDVLKKVERYFRDKKPIELLSLSEKYLGRIMLLKSKQDDASLLAVDQAQVKLVDVLYHMKLLFYGESGHVPTPVDAMNIERLSEGLLADNGKLLKMMANAMCHLIFESKKYVASIFGYLITHRPDDMVNFVTAQRNIIDIFVSGYASPSEVALNCGKVLRDMIGNPEMVQLLLSNTQVFDDLMGYCQVPAFDVSSDVLDTLKELLTLHQNAVFAFLDQHHVHVLHKLVGLLTGESVIAKGWSLQLIWQLLTTQDLRKAMVQFIGNEDYLKLLLRLLREPHANRQLETWNILKLFIANDMKTEGVTRILSSCRDGFYQLLPKLQALELEAKLAQTAECGESQSEAEVRAMHVEELEDENRLLLQRLAELPAPTARPSTSTTPASATPMGSPACGRGEAQAVFHTSTLPPAAAHAAHGPASVSHRSRAGSNASSIVDQHAALPTFPSSALPPRGPDSISMRSGVSEFHSPPSTASSAPGSSLRLSPAGVAGGKQVMDLSHYGSDMENHSFGSSVHSVPASASASPRAPPIAISTCATCRKSRNACRCAAENSDDDFVHV